MILIIGRFQVRSDQIAGFQSFARQIIQEERPVPGCVGFDILQDIACADHFVMMEQWRNRAALDHHLNSEAYALNDAKLNRFTASAAEWVEYEV